MVKKPKINPVDLALYLLAIRGPMNQLKVQKLLYYIQAWHLVFTKQSLFKEDFEAWVHGPVLRSVWDGFKEYSKRYGEVKLVDGTESKYIKIVEDTLDQEQKEIISDVLEEYGDCTPYHLECLTHSEDPWIEARRGIPIDQGCSTTIKKKTMYRYYTYRLNQSS